LGWGFLVDDVMIGVRFAVILMTSSANPNELILWLKVVMNSRLQYESLETLIKFLAFLLPKFWPKKSKFCMGT